MAAIRRTPDGHLRHGIAANRAFRSAHHGRGLHSAHLRTNAFWRGKFVGQHFNGHFDRHFRRHFGSRFIWIGPVYWPYLYGDLFSYSLWPHDYYDPFWAYGEDDILYSLFYPYGDLGYGDYGYAYDNVYGYRRVRHGGTRSRNAEGYARERQATAAAACSGMAPGVSDLPMQRLESIIKPDEQQRRLLDELKAASSRAEGVLKASCPAEPPLTPLSRLDAIAKRLKATDQAAEIIRDPLSRLYGSLNDEQRRRLDGLVARKGLGKKKPDLAQLCVRHDSGLIAFPAQQIELTVTLDEQQRGKLEAMKKATDQAAGRLKSSCPSSAGATPAERLDAAQKRVDALLQAIDTVRPAVSDFYASLTDEQKARFNVTAPVGQGAANTRAP
jgi:hypothetical protein